MSNYKKEKNRYSVPEPLIAPLFYNDEYFRNVSKIKKLQSGFPREDQWRDNQGFHMSFALAGYSKDDVEIEVSSNTIAISGISIDGELPVETDKSTSISKGKIIRGIARRSFNVKYVISEEFDPYLAKATMKHGLLHIVVPKKDIKTEKIVIVDGE